MKTSSKVLWIFFIICMTFLTVISTFSKKEVVIPKTVYQIYLDGKKLGIINDKTELYALINKEQENIKNKYDIDNVYPPNGLEVAEYTTYDEKISTVKQVYNKIKESESFTIKGYTVSIKDKDDNKISFYVLDKNVLTSAINNVVKVFIGEEKYEAYINDTQVEIKETGSNIETIYFDESITLKPSYINSEDKVFTGVDELSQYLLFGTNDKHQKYTVQAGDTIETIAYNNKLNTEEFLIANPTFTSADNLLSSGQEVNIDLINPLLSVTWETHMIEDIEIAYETEVKEDNSKYAGYSETTQEGVKGINRLTEKVKYTNGEIMNTVIISTTEIKPVVNKIMIKGMQASYVNDAKVYGDSTNWTWPTQSYKINSPYGYRSGKFHQAIDIGGSTGMPIYASAAGNIYLAGWWGQGGKTVIINHNNGFYTVYAHLTTINVKKGQAVSKKQVIGGMGCTGHCSGTHLHFGVYYGGVPYSSGSRHLSPLSLFNQ